MGTSLWNPMNAMPANREFEVYHVVDGSKFKMASFHVHDHYEFYIYMNGSIDIAVEEKLYTPEPYALFVYPPGVMHRAVARPDLDRYERAYVYASRECIKSMSTSEFPMMQIIENAMASHAYSFRPNVQAGTEIVTLCDEIIRHAGLTAPADQLINRCRVNILLASLCRLINPENEEALTIPNRMRDVISYINDHLTESLTLDALAERFYVSKYYLLHAFKEYTNLSVHQYIISKRIILAQSLLRDGTTPGDAARACGFNDYAGFYRAFVKQTGVTPQAFLKDGWHPALKKEEKHIFP